MEFVRFYYKSTVFLQSPFLVSLSNCINKQKQNSPTLKLAGTVAISGTNFAEPVECLHLTGALAWIY